MCIRDRHIVVEVHLADNLFATQTFAVPVTPLLGKNSSGPIQIRHDGILRSSRITTRIRHISGYIDSHGLSTLQIYVDFHIFREY